MLNQPRLRQHMWPKCSSSANMRAPQCTAARFEKNVSTAFQKASRLDPSEAGGSGKSGGEPISLS